MPWPVFWVPLGTLCSLYFQNYYNSPRREVQAGWGNITDKLSDLLLGQVSAILAFTVSCPEAGSEIRGNSLCLMVLWLR